LPKPASRRPSRGRLHGTMRAPVGLEPTFPERSIRPLHHQQISIQGNGRSRLVLQTKESAPSPPGLEFLLCFRMTGAAERLETKNPSGALAREGFEIFELERASAHSTSERKRARVSAPSAWLKSVDQRQDEA
jgi:hypothetical protein